MKPTIDAIMRKIENLEGDRETIGIRSEREKPITRQHEDCLRQRKEIKAMIEEYAKPSLTALADRRLMETPGAGAVAGRTEAGPDDERR